MNSEELIEDYVEESGSILVYDTTSEFAWNN
jgi:hypothetical protein